MSSQSPSRSNGSSRSNKWRDLERIADAAYHFTRGRLRLNQETHSDNSDTSYNPDASPDPYDGPQEISAAIRSATLAWIMAANARDMLRELLEVAHLFLSDRPSVLYNGTNSDSVEDAVERTNALFQHFDRDLHATVIDGRVYATGNREDTEALDAFLNACAQWGKSTSQRRITSKG